MRGTQLNKLGNTLIYLFIVENHTILCSKSVCNSRIIKLFEGEIRVRSDFENTG